MFIWRVNYVKGEYVVLLLPDKNCLKSVASTIVCWWMAVQIQFQSLKKVAPIDKIDGHPNVIAPLASASAQQ